MDMQSPAVVLALITAFFLWMLYLGWKTSHHIQNAQENFLIGNRNIGSWLVCIGTTMGWVDAVQFGFTPGMAFDMGWSIMWNITGVLLAFLFLAVYAGKVRRRAAETGAYMMGNYFSKTSRSCAILIGGIMTIFFFIWLAMQLNLGGAVLSDLMHIPYWMVIVMMSGVTLAYLNMGGFLSSIRTDLWQFVIFCVFVLVLCGIWYAKPAEWLPESRTLFKLNGGEMVTLFILGVTSTLAAADVWQRIYSAKNDKEAQHSLLKMAVITTGMILFFVSLGFIIKAHGLAADTSNITTVILTKLVPDWLFPLGIITFMAAIMSTIATCTFGMAMTMASDIAREAGWITHDQMPKVCRWLMLVSLTAAILFSMLKIDIVTLGFSLLSITQVPAPVIILTLIGKAVNGRAAFWSMAISLIAFVIGAYYNIFTGPYGWLPLAISSLILAVIELASRKKIAA